jgi:hypothetical protein
VAPRCRYRCARRPNGGLSKNRGPIVGDGARDLLRDRQADLKFAALLCGALGPVQVRLQPSDFEAVSRIRSEAR